MLRSIGPPCARLPRRPRLLAQAHARTSLLEAARDQAEQLDYTVHYIVHCIVRYIVHYIVRYIVHYIAHYIVHYIVHYILHYILLERGTRPSNRRARRGRGLSSRRG